MTTIQSMVRARWMHLRKLVDEETAIFLAIEIIERLVFAVRLRSDGLSGLALIYLRSYASGLTVKLDEAHTEAVRDVFDLLHDIECARVLMDIVFSEVHAASERHDVGSALRLGTKYLH